MLFLFRSAPKVEKRIHSKFFRKFWEEPGYKRTDLHYCTMYVFTITNYSLWYFRNHVLKNKDPVLEFRGRLSWSGLCKGKRVLRRPNICSWNSNPRLQFCFSAHRAHICRSEIWEEILIPDSLSAPGKLSWWWNRLTWSRLTINGLSFQNLNISIFHSSILASSKNILVDVRLRL